MSGDTRDRALEWDEMVRVGVVARPHGNKGQVILNADTDFPEQRFRVGAMLYARRGVGAVEKLVVTAVRFHRGRPIIGFDGIDSIDAAERIAGAELRIPESDQEPLPAGTYYHHQLIGCVAVTDSGETLGKVTAVEGGGQASRLIVRGRRGELMIPLAQDICDVDLAGRRIVVRPPDGLLDVNA